MPVRRCTQAHVPPSKRQFACLSAEFLLGDVVESQAHSCTLFPPCDLPQPRLLLQPLPQLFFALIHGPQRWSLLAQKPAKVAARPLRKTNLRQNYPRVVALSQVPSGRQG